MVDQIKTNSPLRICLLGPANPGQLRDFMFAEDNGRAAAFDSPSGQSVVILARQLLKAGHSVYLASLLGGEQDVRFEGERFVFEGIASSRRARWRAITFWRKESRALASAVNRANCDVVHAHWTYEYARAGLRTGKPLLITARDAPWTIVLQFRDAYRFSRLLFAHWVALLARRKGVQISAVSPYLAEAWKREMLWSRAMPIVANAAEAVTVRSSKSEHPLVVELADGSPRKNVKNLLKAMKLVREKMPQASLALLGHGLGEDGPIADWARKEDLSDGVVFMGHQKRDVVVSMIGSAWVHAHVAREESFGLTVVEAMAAGTPVIGGKDSGAVPWILDQGRFGLVVDIEDSQDLADGILKILSDRDLRERLAEAGRERYRKGFRPQPMAESYFAIYMDLVRRSGHYAHDKSSFFGDQR